MGAFLCVRKCRHLRDVGAAADADANIRVATAVAEASMHACVRGVPKFETQFAALV